jgi:hypothetical protein
MRLSDRDQSGSSRWRANQCGDQCGDQCANLYWLEDQ